MKTDYNLIIAERSLVKKLQVYSEDKAISKRKIHSLVSKLKSELNLNILFLSISFINSKKLREINKTYLKHDYETDVITFNYSKKIIDIDGEILISLDEALINAKKYKVSYSGELSRLIVHGILHLLNYDDNTEKNRKIMKKIENKLINKFNFTLLEGR